MSAMIVKKTPITRIGLPVTEQSQPVEPESPGSTCFAHAFSIDVIVEDELNSPSVLVPSAQELIDWAFAALSADQTPLDTSATAAIAIKVVSLPEMTQLNHTYADKNRPTNVLSFPAEPLTLLPCSGVGQSFELPEQNFLGDIAICAEIVMSEAQEQGKTPAAHWAHMVVHGVLHLCGFDHINDADAQQMETFETQILNSLGFPDPYTVDDSHGAGPNQPLE